MADNPVLSAASEYAADGRTGTLMVVFDDNSIGRFYLAGGLLATGRYRNKEGQEALGLTSGRSVANVRFHENADLVRSAELIDGVDVPQAAPTAPRVASRPAASAAPVYTGPKLTHVMRTGLEELLAEYVGPVAAVLLAELPENIDVDSAIDQISREISDSSSAAEFVRNARKIASG
jgi:hypothetical protein